ncbi:hypothetical protein [Glycomyces xiaoerkulensis]|uniref:hypothetical protein n=1 Tax=Glycomyces xiaoerkulensis TaxID=2038139 RepID=UPI000C26005A|nr:hypothetical protein [Glycomyces xiaoerkulensis]
MITLKSLLTDSRQERLLPAWWQDLVTTLLSLWFIGGFTLDLWAHATGRPESFWTWWHLSLYSGFAALAGWVALLVLRNLIAGRHGPAAVPVGYGPAVVGAPLFLLMGVADMLWHSVFGIETSIDAFFSPSHLGLAVGSGMMVIAPWLAVWRRRDLSASPRLGPVVPGFIGFSLFLLMLLMFFRYVNAFAWTAEDVVWMFQPTEEHGHFPPEARGLAGAVVGANAILTGSILVVARRFRAPAGAHAILFAGPALVSGATVGFDNLGIMAVLLGSGVLADLWTRVRPLHAARRADLLAFAAGWSVVTWLAYFVVSSVEADDWPAPEMWTGPPVAAALAAVLVVLLVHPRPAEAPE